ncbi:hypothetical protein E2562_036826 [Oryza meyeriana var. granulata]|uniref:Uncharacterized protein n=1 Tax=Oryza meyeriana var. granulata TaxID=110450 RepID=A0A6G1E8F0_9ORYZ|nr:hypothetical protein E2562_036826 [Oryza meyeriana var. granulata]
MPPRVVVGLPLLLARSEHRPPKPPLLSPLVPPLGRKATTTAALSNASELAAFLFSVAAWRPGSATLHIEVAPSHRGCPLHHRRIEVPRPLHPHCIENLGKERAVPGLVSYDL